MHNVGFLATELQKIYDSEINIAIGWLWDGGITVRLGDEVNGYLADEAVPTIADVSPGCKRQSHTSTRHPVRLRADPARSENVRRRSYSNRRSPDNRSPARSAGSHAAPPGMDQMIQFWSSLR